MEKLLFFDLEETLIVSLRNHTLVNKDFIKQIIEQEKTNQVHLFSFALSGEKEKTFFEKNLKGFLEDNFEIEILSWPSVEDIMKEAFKFNNNHFDQFEFSSLWGKTRAFHDFCQSKFTNAECVLVDDVVQNSTFILHDKQLTIRTIRSPNIKGMFL